ncbi:MAG: hypothetical protein IJ448_00630, partial [Oscillospiraceae bacterium]|nr:hypothetical protein [Oscillospiraceae bacterium]
LEEKVPELMRGRMRWPAKQNWMLLTPLRGYTSSVSFADSFSSRRSLLGPILQATLYYSAFWPLVQALLCKKG